MSKIREIRSQIGSIKNTQKITSAMELVAASKMRKAQDRMNASRPYADKIRQVISHVAASHSEYHHPYLEQRSDIKNVGFVVVTSDRGLCGGLNINLFRNVIGDMKHWDEQQVQSHLCLIGRKGEAFFKKNNAPIIGMADHIGDAPSITSLIGIVRVMLDHFEQGKLDAVYLASNQFVNTMKQTPVVRQLLPLKPDPKESKGHWDYIYEPDSAKLLLDQLLVRYIESQVYQAVIENIACFQAAQMVAMKSATDNAGELIKELQLAYNKARQASITREIAEIVAGADAIN